jgi:polar amino acid transport system substrate-binding protein
MTGIPGNRRPRRWAGVPVAVATLSLLASACGGGSTGATPPTQQQAPTQQQNAALHDQLPDNIKQAGAVRIGTEALYPPFESFAADNKTIVGLDPDLAKALTQLLGVKMTMTHTAFEGLLTALDGGRFDLVMAAITDTKVRQAKYDFVDYFSTGQSIVVKKGNPAGIKTIEDLCGKDVAVLVNSTQQRLLVQFNTQQCKANPIKVTALPSDKDALLQVQTGRAQADLTQDATGRYNARTIGGGNQFEVANAQPFLPVPIGIVFDKGDTQLRDAFQAALKELIANGRYDQILAKNDLSSGAMKDATINGGTS